MLTGQEIIKQQSIGGINITPYMVEHLNPNSYDLTLHHSVLTYGEAELDARQKPLTISDSISIDEGYLLQPGELYLMQTQEHTHTDKFIPCIEGKSSLARLGISIHATAGFGDIGFDGRWTLEVTCIKLVRVYVGMRIAQIYFFLPHGEVSIFYKGK